MIDTKLFDKIKNISISNQTQTKQELILYKRMDIICNVQFMKHTV